MHSLRRTIAGFLIALLAIGAMVWAISFGTLEPADFSFVNGTEVKSIDPALVDGEPEGRIIWSVFEGLYRNDPKTLEPIPGVAASMPEISEDKKTYTFTLRDDARWTDGTPVTAQDFHWTWQRFLHPATAARYTRQLYYVAGAKKYNTGDLEPGDPVEIELGPRPREVDADGNPNGTKQLDPFPRGPMRYGKLVKIDKPPKPEIPQGTKEEDKEKIESKWRETWVYSVSIDGKTENFCRRENEGATHCHYVLYDFREVGIKVLTDGRLQVTLQSATPYFLHLLAFYPLSPVNRTCFETHGFPNWTKPENIVSNGAFRIQERRIRDRIRLVKSESYWNAENVHLNRIDAFAVESPTTGLNLYLSGMVDWITTVPTVVIPELKKRGDLVSEPRLATYFFRLNVRKPPLDNVLVRQALNAAIDKREICEAYLKSGQQPARSLVPPGLHGYESALCGDYDPEQAQRLLAEAGYGPGKKKFPRLEVLYNDLETHKTIAEMIMSHWQKNLNIDIELKSLEWGSFLSATETGAYTIARAGWIGDYPDPNTFLDMFLTGGENNETGWSNKTYDRLIEVSTTEADSGKRMKILRDAERILMDELPIIPIYFYVSTNLVRPYVEGFESNSRDSHPLWNLSIDKEEKQRIFAAEGLR